MSRSVLVLVLALALTPSEAAFSAVGIPDRVPAATLLVPMFETGIDPAVNPHDTLLVVHVLYESSQWIHWQYWTVDGVATALHGNVILAGQATWSVASRDLIQAGPAVARADLVDGPFYRGFVTIDVVTEATELNPRQAGYPFDTGNDLLGYIYYTRLSQGSANGLPMVSIEAVGPDPWYDPKLLHFYQAKDHRESIDVDARACNLQVDHNVPCAGAYTPDVNQTYFRVFGSTPLSGASRLVVFAWTLDATKGPSELCRTLGTCEEYVYYERFDESGANQSINSIRLPHVVNLIPVVSPDSGFVIIRNIPSVNRDTQIYAFSFNSAAPAGNPNLTWDAIFEAAFHWL